MNSSPSDIEREEILEETVNQEEFEGSDLLYFEETEGSIPSQISEETPIPVPLNESPYAIDCWVPRKQVSKKIDSIGSVYLEVGLKSKDPYHFYSYSIYPERVFLNRINRRTREKSCLYILLNQVPSDEKIREFYSTRTFYGLCDNNDAIRICEQMRLFTGYDPRDRCFSGVWEPLHEMIYRAIRSSWDYDVWDVETNDIIDIRNAWLFDPEPRYTVAHSSTIVKKRIYDEPIQTKRRKLFVE